MRKTVIQRRKHLSNPQIKIDGIYLELAMGAFIRFGAKWLEMGELKVFFIVVADDVVFALEKINK